ncbi:MAG TPA: FAD-dependent oxidoreductase [Stellaceae bacterium]
MSVLSAADRTFAVTVGVAIIGAGACGMIAGLTAHDAGAEVMLFERDAIPRGSTALSSGFIPAAGTRYQRARGIADSPDLLIADIQRKSHGESDPVIADAVARHAAPAIEWLADAHGLEFVLVEGFLYPGHSVLRMHAHPRRTGDALMGALTDAVNRAGIDIVTDARVTDLYVDPDGRVRGFAFVRPDGTTENVGCDALVLACNGYGGNADMVRRFIPEMADALYFGHAGNQGDAVRWGEALGGVALDMGAYQGHGSVAQPHNILITWALMMEGGFQINAGGARFSNEHHGYSEQAVSVLAQPDGVAWCIYDERIHALGHAFADYRDAEAAGAIRRADNIAELAALTHVPPSSLGETFAAIARYRHGETDPFGRDFTTKPTLALPYYAIRVTGALFHTQGGIAIDGAARVLRRDGTPLPNLFAGGGAARGVSGSAVWGYLSGNGLLSAVALGRIAGRSAAALVRALDGSGGDAAAGARPA